MKSTIMATTLISATSALVPRFPFPAGNTTYSNATYSNATYSNATYSNSTITSQAVTVPKGASLHMTEAGRHFAGMNRWGGDDVERFQATFTIPEIKVPELCGERCGKSDDKFEMTAYVAMDDAFVMNRPDRRSCDRILMAGIHMQVEYGESQYRAFHQMGNGSDLEYFYDFDVRPGDQIELTLEHRGDQFASMNLWNDRSQLSTSKRWKEAGSLCSDRVGCYVTTTDGLTPVFGNFSFDGIKAETPHGKRGADLVEPISHLSAPAHVDCTMEANGTKVDCKYVK